MSPDHLSRKRLWVFDLDGTLTRPVHDFAAIRRVLGVPPQEDIIAYLDQLPAEESRRRHRQLQQIEYELACQSEAAPGVVECLRWLARNAELGVLTRNTRDHALLSLEAIGVGELFAADAVLGRECAPPKPAPDGICQLMARVGATPVQSVMVGDFVHDLRAGRSAGVTTVHVDFRGLFEWAELADHRFDDFSQLHAFLLGGVPEP
ncbi:HAD family hydrolase [Aestuariirhabdus litorea]|uniref:HAD family hydrolase n=1 Tax=Aestuariirhabdus litorea TaxID=2528527 RepID=A0A3P3VQT4_9GAMM|nr:HAD family hydrolase [Aestuariirhabdus litorea]RRJ83183.1 HAD family hydrolase [Aestuariirhabdus litorea]RWW93340.1 HAD family hydrolase [Endozoicomonadaceae bacterium GTF-13]